MNRSNFFAEWGLKPDSLNFPVSAEEYCGDLFIIMAKPRREMFEEVVVHACKHSDLHYYLWESVRVVAAQLGFKLPEEPPDDDE